MISISRPDPPVARWPCQYHAMAEPISGGKRLYEILMRRRRIPYGNLMPSRRTARASTGGFPCLTLSISRLVPVSCLPWRPMPPGSTGCEPAMLIISFLIALALAVYLVVTLLAPERF